MSCARRGAPRPPSAPGWRETRRGTARSRLSPRSRRSRPRPGWRGTRQCSSVDWRAAPGRIPTGTSCRTTCRRGRTIRRPTPLASSFYPSSFANALVLLHCESLEQPMSHLGLSLGQNAKNSNGAYLVRCCLRKRTLERTCPLVAFVPLGEICAAATNVLFDHVVAVKEGRRSLEAERFLRLEVDHQFVLGRRLNSLSFCAQRFSGFASMSDEELR